MPTDFTGKKIAIVYDWIDKWGGVERVLLELHRIFPEAPLFTSYRNRGITSWARDFDIRESFMGGFPDPVKKNRILSLPFYPYAFESLDLGEFDLVISVSSSFAKSVITRPPARHLCYLLTPTRFLWSHINEYVGNGISRFFIGGYLDGLRKWDKAASRRPDKIISISETVRKRCMKYYGLESDLLYPPFDASYWLKIKSEVRNTKLQTNSRSKIPNSKYFLVVSRLEKYKRIDLAIRVFNGLKRNLVIVGEGTQENHLKGISSGNVFFMSKLSDSDLAAVYSGAEALIMPQEEDFGYVALEAMVLGCPVIAYGAGGATETVTDGRTGILFRNQSVSGLTEAIERFDAIKYNLKDGCRDENATIEAKFGKSIFVKSIRKATGSETNRANRP